MGGALITSRVLSRAAAFLGAALIGVATIAVAVGLDGLKFKETVLVLAAIAAIPLMALTRQVKAVALIGWILSLTYFRVFTPSIR
ncbi:MAG: hypothetical protein M3Y07_02425 [Acidobacteriota bacterium]|nr:hypothetical protein [Acidobacteriota bacterium]